MKTRTAFLTMAVGLALALALALALNGAWQWSRSSREAPTRPEKRFPQIVFDGNSLTSSAPITGGPGYFDQARATLPAGWSIRNVAVSGAKTPDLIAHAPALIDQAWSAAFRPHGVVIWEVTNDLKLGATRATAYNNIVTYCQGRQAAGAKVVLLTVLPRTQGGLPATFEADRQAINALMRDHWQEYADRLVDVGADPTLGPAGAANNTAYYYDGVHLTTAGSAIIAGLVAPVVRSVGEGEPMAGGPIFPRSTNPITGPRVFPNFHAAANAHTEGLGYEASLGADSTWRLWYQMPPTLPTGTMKLLLRVISAGAGNVRLNPKWKSFAAAETISSPTLNAEGVATITTVADQFIETKITLDADTPVAGEEVLLDLVGETASWTLASVATVVASIIWE